MPMPRTTTIRPQKTPRNVDKGAAKGRNSGVEVNFIIKITNVKIALSSAAVVWGEGSQSQPDTKAFLEILRLFSIFQMN
jgi:hypothetical protein